MNAPDIIAATTITQVWMALGGDMPKRCRARAFYREGTNQQAVSLNDSKGCWFDHRDLSGGGVLDLIQRVLGCDRADALRWLSDFTGLQLEDRPTTRAEQRASAERRAREQREVRSAEYFRIAAASMVEQVLDQLAEAVPERYAPTQLLLKLRASQGTALVAIYLDFLRREPQLTEALVYAGERAWQRLCTRLAHFVAAGMEVSNVA